MNLTIRGKFLHEAVSKMNVLATHGIASGCTYAGRITIEAQRARAMFRATNGHQWASFEVSCRNEPQFHVATSGRATVAAGALWREVRRVAGGTNGDHRIQIALEGEYLTLVDLFNGTNSRVKCTAPPPPHPRRSLGDATTLAIPGEAFVAGVARVVRYRSHSPYKVRYHMMLLHMLPGEVRFICGDGCRFAVASARVAAVHQTHQYVIPAEQADIISRIVDRDNEITLVFADDGALHVSSGQNLSIRFRHNTEVSYISYETHLAHALRATLTIDVLKRPLKDLMKYIRAQRDTGPVAMRAGPQWVQMTTSREGLGLRMDDGVHTATHVVPARIHVICNEQFSAPFATQFLAEVAQAGCGRHIRFYANPESQILVAEVADLSSETSAVPALVPGPDDMRLRFFFAAIKEHQEVHT